MPAPSPHGLLTPSSIVADREHYWWFDHLWDHEDAIELSETELVDAMRANAAFARVSQPTNAVCRHRECFLAVTEEEEEMVSLYSRQVFLF